MRHTQQTVLHLFEFQEHLLIIIKWCKQMQYVPIKIKLFTFCPLCLCWQGFSSLLADGNYGILVQIAASLNSTECFVLQSGSAVFTWHGNQCSLEQQQLATKVAEFLKVNLTKTSFLLSFLEGILPSPQQYFAIFLHILKNKVNFFEGYQLKVVFVPLHYSSTP